ncbi:MAG: PilZ domain-containing protein [Terriglobia bacterium]|nr:PilZ domain-containing protein [Terriglobia bacterium]
MFFSPLRDQRRSPRRWISLPIHILMGKSRMEGTTLNLSDHGMYLFTAANISLGSEIKILFRPPAEKETIQLSAIVRRKVVYLYGIEFIDCSKSVAPQVTAGKITPDSRPESRECATPDSNMH